MLGKRVLVIEDDKDSLHATCELLRRAGHEVLAADTARQGLSLLQGERPPDLVVLDEWLADINGRALLAVRARSAAASRVPAVLLMQESVLGDAHDQLRQLGVIGVLSKPLDAGELLELVARARPLQPESVSSEVALNPEADTAVVSGGVWRVRRLSDLLTRVSELLAQGTDLTTQLRDVARAIVPAYATACVIERVDTAAALREVLWTQHESPALEVDLRAWARQPSWLAKVLTEVAEQGKPRLLSLQSEADFAALGGSRDDVASARALGIESVVVVPMIARRRLFGMLTCASREAQRYGRGQLDTLTELGHRLALALDNAELTAGAQQLRCDCDEMVSALATELQVPLLAIVEAASCADVDSTATTRSLRDAVLREAQRAQDALLDLQDLALLKSGQMQLRARELDLTALMRRVVDADRASNSARDLRLQVDAAVADAQVHCDAERLAQALRALLRTAPAAGSIEVALSRVDHALQVTVTDSGPRLSEYEVAVLNGAASYAGAASYELENAKARQGRQQPALPLRLARALVEAQGGSFWAETSHELGNSLHFSFPACDEAEARPQDAATTCAAILLVDCDVAFRRELQEILSERGYHVETADNGLQAWQYLLANPAPELILFDLALPSMDGWELHAAIRSHKALQTVPTVVVSGLDRYRVEASLPDAQGYIEKPIRTAQLFEIVQRYVTSPARPRTLSVRPGSC